MSPTAASATAAPMDTFAHANGAAHGKDATLSDELARRGLQRIKDTDGVRGRGFKAIAVKLAPIEPHWSDGR